MSRRARTIVALLAVALTAAGVSPLKATLLSVPSPTGRLTAAATAELSSLGDTTPWAGIVSFREGTDEAGMASVAAAHGLTVLRSWPLVSGAYLAGPAPAFRALAASPGVTLIDANRTLAFHDESDGWATNVRIAQEPVAGGPYFDKAGRVLDGTGVGVAIVDSGVNAAHPDLTGAVAKNFKIVCPSPFLINTETERCYAGEVFVEVPPGTSTDTSSGHGTHVAGIVAGDGTQSTGDYASGPTPHFPGTFPGVAPGATLFGFSTGEVIVVLYAIEAHNYILEHYDELSPRIRVINNSWGDEGVDFDPESIQARLDRALVAEGVVQVYSAGNSGGFGTEDKTSSTCDNPTPGVVCVANYDDGAGAIEGTGTKSGTLNSSSSKGQAGRPDTYPDISAPGTFITSPCVRQIQPVCNLGLVDEISYAPWYGTISGTSMSAPHVAGTIAMLLQAHPKLTPAQVEDLIQDTAVPFNFEGFTLDDNDVEHPWTGAPYESDPQNEGGRISVDKGAGLLDLTAALDLLGTRHGRIPGVLDDLELGRDGTGETAVPSADLAGLAVTQVLSGGAPAIRYDIALADRTDFAGMAGTRLRIYETVKGVAYQTNVLMTADGVALEPATSTAPASEAGFTDDGIFVVIPVSALGSPGTRDAIYKIFVASYTVADPAAPGPIADALPGNLPGAAQLNEAPMFTRPFSLGEGTKASRAKS